MNEFLSRMQALLGDEYPAFLRYYEGENFRGLRLNTLKCTPDKLKNALPFEPEPTPFCPQGYYIPHAKKFLSGQYLPLFRKLEGGVFRMHHDGSESKWPDIALRC